MENLAQRVKIEANEHGAVSDVQTQSGPLVLSGDQPAAVYVQPYVDNNGKTIAIFGATSTGTFFTGGLSWQCGSEYSLFISFNFMTGVTGMECDAPIPLPYSPVATNGQSQCMAMPPVPGTYKFYVTFSSADAHDPKIVITPIVN